MGMSPVFVRCLRWTLKVLAQLVIWRYRPGIVGITGSVGKTSTKFAVMAVLGIERRVRTAHGNLNNDLGLPLTILGSWSEKELKLVSREQKEGTRRIAKLFFWVKVICRGVFQLCYKSSSYPEILVLEYGADRPGDVRYLLQIARPNIGVVTAVGAVPAHVEFYKNSEEVAREKARLIEYLPAAGFAVLNRDDKTVMALQDRTRAHLVTFGFSEGAEVRISRFHHYAEEGRPGGVAFRLEYGSSGASLKLPGMLGKSQAYAAAAAGAVGFVFGMSFQKVAEGLKRYEPPPHRMQLRKGVKETWIIDDAYNASPLSMESALRALKDLPGKRKIAVLGDMLEIGPYAMEAHENLGRLVAEVADILITVGPRAKLIAEGAKKAKMRKANIKSFDDAEEAGKAVQDLIKAGDLILVKASRAIHLESVVEEIVDLI
ncbi:UDP-N-acetylmuramoyl-tripeptide--D-alanyl-D-alanine ligase [Candidatus Parcubacteria bacterium]|nr:MAG: UDP-N-acetylmuramoyl-tripeptide--D-alanyl-D-alanine ligase [Candidatus Parcubacteria bacterium]